MILTHELIEAGQSRNGGWSEEQLRLLGVEWPPVAGWKERLAGRFLGDGVYAEFVTLKDAHLPPETPSLFE